MEAQKNRGTFVQTLSLHDLFNQFQHIPWKKNNKSHHAGPIKTCPHQSRMESWSLLPSCQVCCFFFWRTQMVINLN